MKSMDSLLARAGFLACLSLSSGTLMAQSPQGGSEQRKPPREAIEACKSLSIGQDCSFTTTERSVKGTCWAPEGKPLACRPKDAPKGGNQPPKK
jgi:hypothetical protein